MSAKGEVHFDVKTAGFQLLFSVIVISDISVAVCFIVMFSGCLWVKSGLP